MSNAMYTCFAIDEAAGSDAYVIEESGLLPSDKLKLAQIKGSSAIVFFEKIQSETYVLDFYYPHARSPLCLHAALAAAKHLGSEEKKVIFQTSQHNKKIICTVNSDSVRALLPSQPEVDIFTENKEIMGYIGIDDSDLLNRVFLVNIGSRKLMFEVKEKNKISTLNPDLKEIIKWCEIRNINGCFVFCKVNDGSYYGRNFNHIHREMEDSATGVAALSIAAIKNHEVKLFQGEHLNNRCCLYAGVTSAGLWIEGCVN